MPAQETSLSFTLQMYGDRLSILRETFLGEISTGK